MSGIALHALAAVQRSSQPGGYSESSGVSDLTGNTLSYVHGYDRRESVRLEDQAQILVELLHSDTSYPEGSSVLEVGCGVGAQTMPLARNSPDARIVSVDISAESLSHAKARADAAGLTNVRFRQADILALPFEPESFDHLLSVLSWSTSRIRSTPWSR